MITLEQYSHFFDLYLHNLLTFAQTYLHNRQQAEDCVMEAYAGMWEKRADIVADGDDALLAWSLTVVRNRCVNILRRQSRFMEDSSDEAWSVIERIQALENFSPDDVPFSEVRDIVARTIAKMPPQTRQIFIDCVEGGLSHKEVASRYGLTVRGVEYHLYKAVGMMHKSLGDYMVVAMAFLTTFTQR